MIFFSVFLQKREAIVKKEKEKKQEKTEGDNN